MTTPAQLLDTARALVTRTDSETAGLWPRAAALLARQALESAMADFWRSKRLPLDACPTRPQLICLREYLKEAALAAHAQHLWSALSRACHHHAYELAPTAGEVLGWTGGVAALVMHIDTTGAGAQSEGRAPGSAGSP